MFTFGGSTGMSYEDIQRKRAVADQMLAQNARAATTSWEGLSQIGRALAARSIERRASEAETQGRSEQGDLFRRLFEARNGGAPVPQATQGMGQPPAVTQASLPSSGGQSSGGALDPRIYAAVQQQESGGDPNAVSPVGATGLMQVMPATARDPGYGVPNIFDMASSMGIPVPDQSEATLQQLLRNPDLNQAFGRQYLDAQVQNNGGDLSLGLAAYNAGPGAVQEYGGIPPFAETQNYVESINGALGNQQAPQGARQEQGGGMPVNEIVALLDNPYTSDGQRMVLSQLLERQFATPETMTPYQRAQLGLAQSGEAREQARFQREMQPDPGFSVVSADEATQAGLPPGAYQRGPDGRVYAIGGGGVTVNNNAAEAPDPGDEKFAEATASQMATMFGAIQQQSLAANANLAQIGQLEGLLQEGVGGGVDNFLASAQRTFGIPVSSEPVEAFNAIIAQLVPGQRVPGSGTMSDRDLELFKESLPRLINTPGGNARILTAMRGLAEYQREQGRIANEAMTGQISRQDAVRQLQAIPNPLADLPDTPTGGAGAPAQPPETPRRMRFNPQTGQLEQVQ